MTESLDIPVVDLDSHVLEPSSIWTEYLEPDYRIPARSAFWRETDDIGTQTILNGELIVEASSGWLTRAASWRPGLTWDDIGRMDPAGARAVNPGAHDVEARLRDMDECAIAQAVVFPTVFGEYFPLVKNPDVADALARAYNNWITDFCSAAPDRLIPVAILPTQSVNLAVRELRRVAEAGFRMAMLRPVYYQQQRFLNHPYFEPLWRELETTGVVASIHPYPGTNNPEWTSHGPWIEKVADKAAFPAGHPIGEAVSPLMDNSTFLIGEMFYALLERFPGIRMVMSHSTATWLPLILEKIEGYLTINIGTTIPVRVDADHVFYEHGAAMIGFDADEQLLHHAPDLFAEVAVWGSRYPNHDAMSATEAIRMLVDARVPEQTIMALMGGNARRLLGLSAPVAV